MKKFLTYAAIASSFAFSGCSRCSSPVAVTSPVALTSPVTLTSPAAATEPQTVVTPADAESTEVSTSKADVPAKPMKVTYVAQKQKWGTLRAKFVVDGKVAEPTKVNAAADPVCAAFGVMTENLIVGKDGGLKNIAIFIDKTSKVKDIHPDLEKPAEKRIVLDNKNCVFVPHVLVVHPGQTVTVKNSDATGHNANFSFFKNDAVNFLVPGGSEKDLKIVEAEPAPSPVECNVHPWMKAFLIIPEHPCVGVSDESGVIEIANVPVGKVTFRAFHELGKLDEVTLGGKLEKWSKNRFDYEIKEGVNDLGTIKISADKFIKK